jgi:hypothetical protein
MSPASHTPLLRIGCGARSSHGSGAGALIVEPGAARFEFDQAETLRGIPSVLHARPPLIFVRARLLPPGLNSSVLIHTDDTAVTILTRVGAMGRLKRALADAEVAFFERVTWTSLGGDCDADVPRLSRGSVAE